MKGRWHSCAMIVTLKSRPGSPKEVSVYVIFRQTKTTNKRHDDYHQSVTTQSVVGRRY